MQKGCKCATLECSEEFRLPLLRRPRIYALRSAKDELIEGPFSSYPTASHFPLFTAQPLKKRVTSMKKE